MLFLWYIPLSPAKLPHSERYGNTPTTEAEPITPIPLKLEFDPARVALGQRLFHDQRLSGDDTVSCASCHGLDHGGSDHTIHSRGVGGREGEINAPTVFNSGFNFRQFWDGRAANLEDQLDYPINNHVEMASSWPQVVAKIKADSEYAKIFRSIYNDGITVDNVKNAIATFERSLYTPNSRFDRFLRGDKSALSENELAGYLLFKNIGCVSCHQGMNVGGNFYEKMGVMKDYFGTRGHLTKADLGRFNLTGIEEQRFEFKVPSLRNVALTAPYFHDGSAKTLEEAVGLMAKHQLGVELNQTKQEKIADFLRTLTGEYRGVLLQ